MKSDSKHISVCICTFRRAAMLKRLLVELARQDTGGQFTYSIVVVDNDDQQSARPVVADLPLHTLSRRSTAMNRGKTSRLPATKRWNTPRGDFIAFIDDDEFPVPEWLRMMLKTCKEYDVAGVLGPVRPHFDESPPRWIIERPILRTARASHGSADEVDVNSRTGNVLFRRRILDGLPQPFRPEFGNGGEDKDFFMRMTQN